MPSNSRGDATAETAPRPGPTTRRRNGSITIPEEYQEIKDATDGRKYLEKYSLLCPPGEPASNAALAICLHQVAAMAGLPKKAINAVRSAAFLLEDLEETAINETIRLAFDSQITEFTADMKLLVDDTNSKIQEQIKDPSEQITKAANQTRPTNNSTSQSREPGSGTTPTYAAALINPPPNVNPKIAAREGIKARQFVLTGIKESAFSQYDSQQLKAQLNKAAKELGMKEGKIRSLTEQRDGNALIEVDSDYSAKWFANKVNRTEFCTRLGESISFKPRLYNVLAQNAPLTIDPEDEKHIEEINEINDLEDNAVLAMRWAKPINRRSPHQRLAHMVLSVSSPEAANRLIANRIILCRKKCYVEKIKKEPTRCLKCQGWNHIARDCKEPDDTCSNCAKTHRTTACPHPHTRWCVSCKTDEHASWSRDCPTFTKKVAEFNERNPENQLPFFPTTDHWTWTMDATNNDVNTIRNTGPSRKHATNQYQRKGKEKESVTNRQQDSYISNYPRWEDQPQFEPLTLSDWWKDPPTAAATSKKKKHNEQHLRSHPNKPTAILEPPQLKCCGQRIKCLNKQIHTKPKQPH